MQENLLIHKFDCTKSETDIMAQEFEPLQNDLIIRTAWGNVLDFPYNWKFINIHRPES